MNLLRPSRGVLGAATIAAATALLATPAVANVNIPEGGAVARDSVSVIHLRVFDGCDGQATDRLEVGIPETVRSVIPAAVPGWTVEVETADGASEETKAPAEVGDDERVSLVRWSGGPLPAGQLMDFGLRAYFPDEAGATLSFPVTQGCGSTEIRWDGEPGSENAAPLVAIGNHVGQRELGELEDTVRGLSEDLAQLRDELTGDGDTSVESRLGAVETRVDERFPEIVDRLNRLADRIGALEEPSQDSSSE